MSKQPKTLNLSKTELDELKDRYKHERDRRLAERIHGIILFAQGYKLKELKSLLFVGLKTMAQWIETFRHQGLDGLLHWGYQGQKPTLSEAQWAQVEQELERNPYHTAKAVAKFVKEQFQVEYSERGMQALLRRQGYRYIKSRLVPGKAKAVDQAAFVEQYEVLKTELGSSDRVYYVDATHPTHNVKISYGWTKKGRRMRIRSNPGRQRYNILGAYCPSDQEYLDIRGVETVNAQTLQQLIDKIRMAHPEANRIILILDNVRYNHARLIRDHLVNTNVELLFLPTYSPNLNLIERLWRFLSGEVMNDTYHASFDEFVAAIAKVLDNLQDYADQLATLMTEKFEILACA